MKFKCLEKDCKHVADEKGFCPIDGKALAADDSDNGMKEVLAMLEDVVKAQVKELVPEQGAGHKLFSRVGRSKAEANEFVKGIMTDVDKAAFEECETSEAKEKFLSSARQAYFFKSLIQFKINSDPDHMQVVKALASGVDADGGYLVPNEFRAELVRDLKDEPILRNLVRVIPMKTNYLELPTLLSSVGTSWGTENASISTTTARFGNLSFVPKRLNTFIFVSRELVSDSGSGMDILPTIRELFVEAIGKEEDRVIVNGSGTGQPKGILQETLLGIDNQNDDATLAASVKALPFRLGKRYRQNARWLVNSLSMGALAGLRDSSTGRFMLGDLENGSGTKLAGYPVEEQNDIPIDTLVFGDLKQYFLADREQVSIETTSEGAGTFEKHQVAIKCVERIDGKVALTLAFRKVTNCGID